MFGWDPEKIVVENQLIGGGFGGKEDVTVQHLTALAAYKYQRPVKAKFTILPPETPCNGRNLHSWL